MPESNKEPVSSLSRELRDLLVAKRQQKNLSLTQVSEWLKMSEKSLLLLESEDMDLTQLDSFQRGYLRNYANLLGVSLDKYKVEFPRQTELTGRMSAISEEEAPLMKLTYGWVFKWGSGLLIVVVLGVLLFAGFN